VAFDPAGRAIATAARDGLVGLRTGSIFRSLAGHEDMAVSLVWWPDGSRLASGARDATIRLWDAAGQPNGVLYGLRLTIWGLAVTPDGSRLLSSSFDHDVRVWRGRSEERVLVGHTRQVGTVAALGCGAAISGARDGTCRIWNLDTGTAQVVRPHTLPLTETVRCDR
jgi:WD40 repeat protein